MIWYGKVNLERGYTHNKIILFLFCFIFCLLVQSWGRLLTRHRFLFYNSHCLYYRVTFFSH